MEGNWQKSHHFCEIIPITTENSYKASRNLTKKQAAVVTQGSRTALRLHVNCVYQGPGRAASLKKVFLSECPPRHQHVLLGGWEAEGLAAARKPGGSIYLPPEGCGPVH